MIKEQLSKANALLEELIKITQDDISNIKEAKHDKVSASVEAKNKLIAQFQNAKKELDQSLLKLSQQGSKNLAQLLDTEDKNQLALMKANLEKLHAINKEYAKLVLIVKDFFDGLLNTMFENKNGTNNAYGDKKTELESLFKINV